MPIRDHHDEDFQAYDGDEPDACCVLCGELLLQSTHWSRIVNRTVLCRECDADLKAKAVPEPPECGAAPKAKRLDH